MSRALEDKRTATRLRVLVEIADRQPAVSQGEIADAVGVTSQAVSEYIRDLVDDGFVEKEGRSRYRVTKEGVDWLFREVKAIRRFTDHVTEDVLQSVQEDAALATERVEAGETVTLSLRDGLLHATPGDEGPATGVATTSAEAGADVSVTGFEGVIEMSPGSVTVLQVPRARRGGSRAVDADALAAAVENADVVVAAGVEAVVALRRVGWEPAVAVAAGAVAAAAATTGRDVAVVASADEVGRVTDTLRDSDATYELQDVAGAAADADADGNADADANGDTNGEKDPNGHGNRDAETNEDATEEAVGPREHTGGS
jgi:putative transcriptional regulator